MLPSRREHHFHKIYVSALNSKIDKRIIEIHDSLANSGHTASNDNIEASNILWERTDIKVPDKYWVGNLKEFEYFLF